MTKQLAQELKDLLTKHNYTLEEVQTNVLHSYSLDKANDKTKEEGVINIRYLTTIKFQLH